MIIQKETRNLIKELSVEFKLSFEETKDIVFSQFKYVKEELAKGDKGGDFTSFKNIILRYLGTFYTKEKKLERLREAKQRKNEKLNKKLQHDNTILGGESPVQDSESVQGNV
jgi:hypothetical protein